MSSGRPRASARRERRAIENARGADRWLFDLWSRFYDAPLVQRLTYRPEQDAVMRRLRARAPRRLLDVGCGTGILAARVERELPGVAVFGCDFSRGMLERAARRSGAVHWVRSDAGRLPFADGSFDTVVSTQAFHWFPDPGAALVELRRLLEPGGWLLVSLVNPPLEAMSRLAHQASRALREPITWPTRRRMRAWTEAAGFRVTEQQLVLRLPATFLLPTILTVAERREEGG